MSENVIYVVGLLNEAETRELMTAPCGATIGTCAPQPGSEVRCSCGEVHPLTDRRRVLLMLAELGSVADPERTRRLLLATLEPNYE